MDNRVTTGPRFAIGLLVAVGCAIAVAACGSSKKPSSTTASSSNSKVQFARCMRSHGVSNFPDPTVGQDGQEGFAIGISAGGVLSVDGVALSGPAFQSASKTCEQSTGAGGILPPHMTQSELQPTVAKAQCLRAHGVSNIPDPTLAPGGYGVIFRVPAGFDWNAPTVKDATKACAQVGALLPHMPA